LVNFRWRFTAAHRTPGDPTGFQYFITKQNWDPNQPLTRAQLDLNPFCTVNGMDRQPFPFGGFCRQYSPGSPAYEPGVGSNSADAWTLAQ
jgi:hypothetical protein